MSVDVGAVLDERARRLARQGPGTEAAPAVEALVVVAGGTRYALETRHVREVVRFAELRRLPAGAGLLRGLVAARGEAVPVADLAELLGGTEPAGAPTFVVVIDGPAAPVGLLVEEASDVIAVPAALLTRRDSGTASPELGVTPDGSVVLDALTVLRDPRLTVPRRSSGSFPLPPGQEN